MRRGRRRQVAIVASCGLRSVEPALTGLDAGRLNASHGDPPASKFAVPGMNLLETPAGSTGRCNTGLQFTRRSFKAQGFSRALIEAQSYLVEIGLRVDGQVGLLGEVLS